MKMGVKVYYSEISGNKEVKKRQQRVMMILDSKLIPYESIDITEPGKEAEKDFMIKNGKPRGESKYVLSPQIFNEEVYCGDYDDFELANENDILEDFLHTPKVERKFSMNNGAQQNGTTGSREGSAEADAAKIAKVPEASPPSVEESAAPPKESSQVTSTTVPEDLGIGDEEPESPDNDDGSALEDKKDE